MRQSHVSKVAVLTQAPQSSLAPSCVATFKVGMTLGRPTPLNKNCGNHEDLAFMFKAEVSQQDGGLADEFGRLLQPESPPVLMDGRFHGRATTRVGKCTALSACSCKGTERTIMKSISAQNGLEGWRQLSVSYTSCTNGKANTKLTELRLEFRSENEFQHKLAEMELLVKAQVTEEEEAEDGGNDKGKSPGKNGGKDKRGKKGDSKGKITFTTWIKSGIGWVGSATTTGYTHQLKDRWRGNMEKGQPCYRLNTIDGKNFTIEFWSRTECRNHNMQLSTEEEDGTNLKSEWRAHHGVRWPRRKG